MTHILSLSALTNPEKAKRERITHNHLFNMEPLQKKSIYSKGIPDPHEMRERHPIEDDSDTLEPLANGLEHREINANDQAEMQYWASEFQISVEFLQAAIVLNGKSVRDIKKYLSV